MATDDVGSGTKFAANSEAGYRIMIYRAERVYVPLYRRVILIVIIC